RSFTGALTIGGRFGLWDGLLLPWLNAMSEKFPDVQLRAQIGFEEDLMMDLVDGSLDIGVMYTPQSRPSLQVEPLINEELILVTSDPTEIQKPNPDRYVHVDWGPEFLLQLVGNLPELSSPRVIVGISWMGLKHILTTHGSGFFPHRLVQTLIQQKRLFKVETAPSFELPAYVVYPSRPENPLTLPMVDTLHQASASVTAALVTNNVLDEQ
ncbi:MAG: substrate-binding domain-containing protein, partial [Sedimenticola sp.]|nr:substrate-binding domain-containing protein [Sedimenticola sp.]